ncbi:unnamed protein product, partial [Laminaria digitata]
STLVCLSASHFTPVLLFALCGVFPRVPCSLFENKNSTAFRGRLRRYPEFACLCVFGSCHVPVVQERQQLHNFGTQVRAPIVSSFRAAFADKYQESHTVQHQQSSLLRDFSCREVHAPVE